MQGSGIIAFIRVVQALVRSRPLNTPLRTMWRVWENDDFPLYEVELEWKEGTRPAWRLYCQASQHKRFYRQYEDALRLYINGFRRSVGIYPAENNLHEAISRIAWLWGDTVGEAPDYLLTNREIEQQVPKSSLVAFRESGLPSFGNGRSISERVAKPVI